MEIIRGRADTAPSSSRSETFTGTVWSDPVVHAPGEVRVGNVFFAPGARTHWHRHERGQVLHVTSGQGRVGTAAGGPRIVREGDTVWISPGEDHWHGADTDTYMIHYSVSLGQTDWDRPVADSDYTADPELPA